MSSLIRVASKLKQKAAAQGCALSMRERDIPNRQKWVLEGQKALAAIMTLAL